MSISKRLRFEVFKRDNFTCQYCGAKPPDTVLEVDHVHPRCEGGTDGMENLKTACWACNRGKGSTPMLAPRIYTLRDGPLAGQVVEVQLATDLPVLWVMRRHDGEIAIYEDEFISDEHGDEWNGQRMRFGHPGFQLPKQPHHGAELEFSMGPWNPNPHPTMLGVYWCHDVPRPGGINPFILGFAEPEHLIVELTA